MKAIILAAGRGSRMGRYSDERPKCLVEVAGKPLLEWQIAALRGAGITDIAVVRGYRGETFENRGVSLFDNPRWAQTNMVMSLAAAAPWLRQEACIISYADIFYPAQAVRSLIQAEDGIAMTYDVNWLELWSARFEDPLSDAETFKLDGQSRVVEIGRKAKSLDEIQGQYMGLLKITPEGWGWIEELLAEAGPEAADKLDMTTLLNRLISAGRAVRGVAFNGFWGECDNPSDLTVYEAMTDLPERLADGSR